MKFILRFVILAITIFLLSKFLPGFSISMNNPIKVAIIASLVLSLLNMFIKPVINLLTLPINMLTLGIFSIVINALLLWVVAWYVDGFGIHGFATAVIGAVIISLVNSLFGFRD